MQSLDWEIIEVLHETGSITKTASRFYMSQPALSRHIRSIESELGISLLLRNKNGSMFTEEGEIVYQKAVLMVNFMLDLKRELLEYTSRKEEMIRIGSPSTFTCYRLPEMLSLFAQKYPKIDVDLFIQDSDVVLEKLRKGLIDLCFVIGDFEEEDIFEKTLLFEDNLYVVYNKPIKQEDIANLQLISFPKNNYLRAQIDKWWDANFDVPRNVKFKVTNGQSCISMIRQGLGYGFFSDNIYFKYMDDLFATPFMNNDGTTFKNYTYIVTRRNAQERKAVIQFVDLIKKNYAPKIKK